MYKIKWPIIGFILLLLVSCSQDELATPTPFPPTPENISLGASASSITPVPAVLADVAANPEFYEGAYLQVTGQYFRSPLQVCGLDPHPSPAGWELVVDDTHIPAGGFDEQLRQLLPDGITVTVIGRFTHWSGPVGCGKQAIPTEMWYLDVVKLVDPAQLARVTLTPGAAADSISDGSLADELFTPVADSEESPPEEDDPPPTAPPVAPPTNTTASTRAIPVETLGAGFTPVATNDIGVSTPTVEGTVDGKETAVSSSTPQTTPGTSTVTNTPPPGASLTPTPAGGSTPIPTASGSSPVIIMDDDLLIDDYKMVELETSEIHEWTMPLDSGEEVILAIIGEPDMDLSIKIYDENLTELANQDSEAAGQMESVTFNPATTNDFKVRITEKSGVTGGYLLALGSEDYFLLYPQGMLTYGTGGSATINSNELHYWFFQGTADDVIDLAISCDVVTDLTVILYDSAGNDIAERFFSGDMQDVLLPETGWYVFEIEIWDDICNYNLIVTD